MSAKNLQAGDLIAGRFVIDGPGVVGGMATVHRAIDRETGVLVAVKILHPPPDMRVGDVHQEARLLARLRHPCIVRYVAYGWTEEGAPYLVTEWIEGRSLDEVLAQGALGIDDAIRLALRIAQGLSALHAAGHVHGDLTPSNIFLPEGGIEDAKLLGFYFTRDFHDIEADPLIFGTPAYMAPELSLIHI